MNQGSERDGRHAATTRTGAATGRRRAQAPRGALVRADRGRDRRVLRQGVRRGLAAGHRGPAGDAQGQPVLLHPVQGRPALRRDQDRARGGPGQHRVAGRGGGRPAGAAARRHHRAHRPRVPEHDQDRGVPARAPGAVPGAAGRDHRGRARLPPRVRRPDRGGPAGRADPGRGEPEAGRAEHPGLGELGLPLVPHRAASSPPTRSASSSPTWPCAASPPPRRWPGCRPWPGRREHDGFPAQRGAGDVPQERPRLRQPRAAQVVGAGAGEGRARVPARAVRQARRRPGSTPSVCRRSTAARAATS